jgi:hypothetical protein
MRKYFRFFTILLLLFLAVNSVNELRADPPNPPVVPGSHGAHGNAGAPLDGILGVLLLGLGAAYGGWMLYDKRRQSMKDQPPK